MIRCPSCRNRALSVLAALTLPNTSRDRIVCRVCGEVLERRPMQTSAEAIIVWAAFMLPIGALFWIGGSFGFGITVVLTLVLLWVAPWQGLTYALPASAQRQELPAARVIGALPGKAGQPEFDGRKPG